MQTPDIDMSETHIIGKYGSFECHILFTTPIYICSHPKTSLNSLTPHRNSISGGPTQMRLHTPACACRERYAPAGRWVHIFQ